MRFLPLHRVRLTGGPFAHARDLDLRYVMSLEPDRLLAPFRREAGLPARAASYGNWEDSGLDGHTAGHVLSALAFLTAAGVGEEAPRRLERMVTELAEIQAANGGGYVGGVPGGQALFEALGSGGPTAVAELASSAHWVPWYNLHKTFQGLIDAHVVAGSAQALAVVENLADWWLPIASRLDDATFERMLDTEYGGMNDAYAQLALLTGRDDYAAAARRFSHRAILDPLLRGEDALTGLHANTQIPKAVGYASTAAATGDDSFLAAADTFWRTVVERRTVAIGGNSVREHFHDARDFTPMIDDREGPEFCNTANMLKLTRALAERELRPEHLDYAERALFNHVLASQHPEHGGFVYFTPMRPRHYRVYSQPQHAFWCCVGTGLETQARAAAEWTFGVEDSALAVNLFLPAEAELPEFGARVRVDADLPQSDQVAISIALDRPRAFPLRVRAPSWAGGLHELRVNGASVDVRTEPGAIRIARTWTDGDRVTFRLPVRLRAERLPDGSGWQAFLAGPSVLAARAGAAQLDGLRADDSRMGHIAHGPLLPFTDLPITSPGAAELERTDDGRILLRPAGADPVELEPFAALHDARYTVYWPVADGDAAARRAELEQLDAGLAVDGATVDVVALGEQQPESDHAFRGTATEAFSDGGHRWRTTAESFAVRMRAEGARTLRVRYRTGADPAAITIRIGDAVVATQHLDAGDEVYDVDYPIGELLAAAGEPGTILLSFAAVGEASVTVAGPAIGTVRLLR
ncbi:beta-L-arabinofuranosidase domain-containing protein [Microbacterium sp. 22242]|uniref:beta-L-arabinofuranosidase domain-containing protein n=1 Tax=Microbacterium sp. 22242 TaxID=3453896 RepID=UPI003F84093F